MGTGVSQMAHPLAVFLFGKMPLENIAKSKDMKIDQLLKNLTSLRVFVWIFQLDIHNFAVSERDASDLVQVKKSLFLIRNPSTILAKQKWRHGNVLKSCCEVQN